MIEKIKFLGTQYGKHPVITDMLNKDSIIYSFGVGKDISFDLELIRLTNCNIFAFDPTPRSIEWVKNKKIDNRFKFFEFGISNKNTMESFSPPPIDSHVSFKKDLNGKFLFPVKNIKTIAKYLHHDPNKIDFVKLDIEGFEYEVLDDFINNDIFPNQIAVEFHFKKDYINWINSKKELTNIYYFFEFDMNEIFFVKK